MKAAVHTRYGSPDVVQVVEVRTPTPGEREVLVKVHATTVNRTDCGFRAAKPWIVRFFSGLTKPKATINGSESAGVVETVGAGVTAFAVGERVFGFSERRFGAHAEYLAMPEDGPIAPILEGLSFEEVAPSRGLPLRPREHQETEIRRSPALVHQAGKGRLARNAWERRAGGR